MALSIKIFGSSLWALRLPSIILGSLSVYLTYRIGLKLFNKRMALIGTFLHAIHGMLLELVGGRISSDHVETCFLFFSQLFICLYVEKKHNYHLFLAGLVLGMAFLCKWISAFIPLFVITTCSIMIRDKSVVKDTIRIIIPFFTVIILWLAYIYVQFPIEATFVIQSILGTVMVSTEHVGGPFFYLNKLRIIFGELIYVPILLMSWDVFKNINHSSLILIFVWIILPILLLSIASTKRATYLMVSAPALFLLTAIYFEKIYRWGVTLTTFKRVVSCTFSLLLIVLPIRYSFERIKPFGNHKVERIRSIQGHNLTMDSHIIKGKSLIVGDPFPIETMFYTGVSAYGFIPEKKVIDSLQKEDFLILIRRGDLIEEY